MEHKQDPKPTCAVRGSIRPGFMCGYVIVGGKYCGYLGECPHKQEPAAKTEGASHDH
ncbi:hypothetical protein C7440_1022 [Pusillimonas noertemannii]|uniref:Uncharacterized protein n=1 Tax=Pusillimonas noertemannii TaxID=305977 RepID=A0A2U1CS26_9BURK|nr:hypothetical protein C7440_1022 [Pusillimonas noertemannii]